MIFPFSRLPLVCLALIAFALPIGTMACSGRLHIEVQDAGVYALDYAAIVAAQPGLKDCPAGDLMLLNRGKEVPIRLAGGDNGSFAAGNRIEWIGQALHGPQSWYDPYSAVNVYLLGAARGAHARMRELPADAAPAAAKPVALRRTLHFEQENLMLRLSGREMKPGDEPDVWQWAKLTPIDAQPFRYSFDLPDADLPGADRGPADSRKAAAHAPADDVAITLDFRGVSNIPAVANASKPPDHVVEAKLNGNPLATLQWDGRDEVRKVVTVARSLLHAQGNTLSLAVSRRAAPGDPANFIIDVAMFNWLEVSYPLRNTLPVSTAPFAATLAGPIELDGNGATNPQLTNLYGEDGVYRRLTPVGNGRLRAAAVNADVDLHPLRDGQWLSPALIRPVAAADLRATAADYVIVAHPRLLKAIQPLAQYHREHGHQVAVVDVEDVYDQFNDGVAHPVAIRNLLGWGMQHWTIKPRYLLLVGDASTDIHHDARNGPLSGASYQLTPQPAPAEVLAGTGFGGMQTYAYPESARPLPNRNLIPTWQFPTGEGQSASDNDFVALKPGDFHPTLAVGRFPVVEPAEVKAIVDKTLAYLSKPAPGPWRHDVTFVSTSEVASFKQGSDKIAADLGHQGFAANNLYTDFNDKDVAHYQQARTTLRNYLDAGSLLVHFLGHGGSYVWRVGPMGDLFSLDDVSHLQNVGRYPMVLAMTCFSAPFDNPTDDSIGERFLREADKGAVAVFASSWKDSPNPQYSEYLIAELLKPGNPIGDAIVAAKDKIADRDFVEMYNLLGDPALVLARPQGALLLARTADRWNPQVAVRIPAADFGGDVDVVWSDADGKTLLSRRYQARDTQFALPTVEHAALVSVYVADTRNGNTAVGGLSLLDPPKPVNANAGVKPVVTTPAQAAPPPADPKRPRNPQDIIAQRSFDSAAVKPMPPRAQAKRTTALGR